MGCKSWKGACQNHLPHSRCGSYWTPRGTSAIRPRTTEGETIARRSIAAARSIASDHSCNGTISRIHRSKLSTPSGSEESSPPRFVPGFVFGGRLIGLSPLAKKIDFRATPRNVLLPRNILLPRLCASLPINIHRKSDVHTVYKFTIKSILFFE